MTAVAIPGGDISLQGPTEFSMVQEMSALTDSACLRSGFPDRGTVRVSTQHPSPDIVRSPGTNTQMVEVQTGDTAWDISLRYGLTLEELQEHNPERVLDCIFPGDIMHLPLDAIRRHDSFKTLQRVRARCKDTVPGGDFWRVFPPHRGMEVYREKHRVFLDALRWVETSHIMPAPVGDEGLSIGPLQISEDYHTDAWEMLEELASYRNCEEVEYAEHTAVRYWLKFCPWALEFGDYQTLAKVHNGGPGFYRYIKTARYCGRTIGDRDHFAGGGSSGSNDALGNEALPDSTLLSISALASNENLLNGSEASDKP
eukprot:jgi/Mesen1/4653/ME000241S03693